MSKNYIKKIYSDFNEIIEKLENLNDLCDEYDAKDFSDSEDFSYTDKIKLEDLIIKMKIDKSEIEVLLWNIGSLIGNIDSISEDKDNVFKQYIETMKRLPFVNVDNIKDNSYEEDATEFENMEYNPNNIGVADVSNFYMDEENDDIINNNFEMSDEDIDKLKEYEMSEMDEEEVRNFIESLNLQRKDIEGSSSNE